MATGRKSRTSRRLARAETRVRLLSDEDTVTTSLMLPRGLHEQLRIAALRLNWTFAEVIRTAAREWLDAHPEAMSGSREDQR
jgi:hypothetical protein